MSWPMVELGKYIKYIRGVTFKPDDLIEPFSSNSIVVMRTKNVQVSGLTTSDLIAIPVNLVKRNEQKLQNGDLLISSANSWDLVGKASYIDELGYEATAGGFISIVRPLLNKIDARYLFHWIMSPKIQQMIRHCGRQTTNISNLDIDRFKALEIPLPPLEEQKRIAAILDKAYAIRQKRKQAIDLADEFLRSVFLDMFGDPVTNPKGWGKRKIKYFSDVTTGNTPSRKELDYYGRDLEWIKSDNINSPQHILTKAKEYLSFKGLEVARTVDAGSILITCIAGSFDCIGNVAYADRKVAFNQQINALTPKPEQIRSWFLYALILYSKKIIQNASTNAMKGMISKGKLENVELMLPSMELQLEFERVFDIQKQVVSGMHKAFKEADINFYSLSQKAFSGQL